MNFIKKVSFPIGGVTLGTVALGNLLAAYNPVIRSLCGILAAFLLALMLLKLLLFPGMVKEEFNNPIMASVAGTFPMAIMLLSVYLKPCLSRGAYLLWWAAIILHLVLIAVFTHKFIFKLNMPKVFASYYIVYVGIVVAAITASAYQAKQVGQFAFWFGFLSLLVLLCLVTYRYIKYSDVPPPAKPLICIYGAPASLCLAGYLQVMSAPNSNMVNFLMALASILYIFSLINMFKLLRTSFSPSKAAFTFPFVISAIAMKQYMAFIEKQGSIPVILPMVVKVEVIIATLLVLYVYVCFIKVIFGRP